MRYFLIALLTLSILLAGCGIGGGGDRDVAPGVLVGLLNAADLREVYLPITTDTRPTSGAPVGGSEDYALAFSFNTLIHNAGYSDTIVAQYVSGYDPNLFLVRPVGPFSRNYERRYCYKQAAISGDFDYSVDLLCAAAEDVYIGGGITGGGGQVTGGGVTIYLNNIAQWLTGNQDQTNSEINFLDIIGLGDVRLDCGVGDRSSQPNGVLGCVFNWGIQNYALASSRGTIALALYGGDVRNCANGCTAIPPPPQNYLKGDQVEYPGGEQVYLDYRVYVDKNRWPANLNSHDQLFQFDTCSLYTTYVTPSVCIDATPGSQSSEVCRPGRATISTFQAAPLRVTSIEQQMQGPRAVFNIEVQQSAPGTLLAPGAVDFCAPGAPQAYLRQQENVVEIVDIRLLGSLDPLDCVNDFKIRMQNGVGRTTCTYDIPPNSLGRPAYITTLNLEVAYMHKQTSTVPVKMYRT